MNQQLQKMPQVLLHVEGAAVFITALVLYAQSGLSWWWFALLLFAPDLSMIGYLRNEAIGSLLYNIIHTYVLPIALGLTAWWFNFELGWQLAIIWLAHIGMDRLVGYGLKYPENFKATHFSKV